MTRRRCSRCGDLGHTRATCERREREELARRERFVCGGGDAVVVGIDRSADLARTLGRIERVLAKKDA